MVCPDRRSNRKNVRKVPVSEKGHNLSKSHEVIILSNLVKMNKELVRVLGAVCDGFEQMDAMHIDLYKDTLKTAATALGQLEDIESKLLRKQK